MEMIINYIAIVFVVSVLSFALLYVIYYIRPIEINKFLDRKVRPNLLRMLTSKQEDNNQPIKEE